MITVGIIGCGNIAHRVAKGIEKTSNAQLIAVASRDIVKAKKFADQYNVETYYGNYAALCESDVDMVYICTPNHLHKEHIKLALSYHKHVMCEKPMVPNKEDLKDIFRYASMQNCFLMGAHKTVCNPLNRKIFDIINQGRIGDIVQIDASYAHVPSELPDWVKDPMTGGALYDIGVYPISYANMMANSRIRDAKVLSLRSNEGYIHQAQGIITYENGCQAHILCSWLSDMDKKGYGTIYGTKGIIRTKDFWKNTTATITNLETGAQEEINVDMESDFVGEIEHAASCIERGLLQSPWMDYHASKQILKVIKKAK